ncbi:MAG: hypothetical protein JRE13_05305 [Deltaproteobacteria bacterium]|nr:hypothetical protein [Deltaproteobacteria bacterium]
MSSDQRKDRRDRTRAAAVAALLAFVTALAVLLATPDDGFWINDCGNKALVAKRLLETGFRDPHFDHPAVAVDPSARAFPIAAPFAVERPGGFLSSYPLAYAVLSAPFLAAFGPIGLRLPAAFGLAACAASMVLWLAPAFGRRWALLGGLTLAFATPLFFYGVTLWEHSLTVALCLGAWGLLDRDSPARLFAAGWMLASACWLREEIALMGVAVAIAVWLQWRRPGVLLWLAAGAALPALALLGVNEWLYGTPLGAHLAASRAAGAEASGLSQSREVGALQALSSLLAGIGRHGGDRALLGTAALAAPALGWFAARHLRAAPPLAAVWALVAGVGLAAWGLAVTRMLGADQPLDALVRHNGLLVQMPMVALVGIGAAAFRDLDGVSLRVGVLSGSLFLLFTLIAGVGFGSGYGVQSGFGVHWGPRVLLPALPALVALVVAAVRAGLASSTGAVVRTSCVAATALLLAGLLSSGLATAFLAEQKRDASRFQRAVRAQPERFMLSTHPLLAQHLAGLWDDKPQLLATDPASLAAAMAGLRAGGAAPFLLVVPAGAPAASLAGATCTTVDRYRGDRLHYFDLDIQRCRFEREPRRRRK